MAHKWLLVTSMFATQIGWPCTMTAFTLSLQVCFQSEVAHCAMYAYSKTHVYTNHGILRAI